MDGGNGMPAGMLSSSMTGAGGFLGLDMSLQHHHHHHQHGQQQQLLQHPPPPPPPPQQHMMPFQTPPPSNDGDHQPQHPMRHSPYNVPPFGVLRAKQQPAMSSEDDSGFGDVEVDADARRGAAPQGMPSLSQQSAPSPWQRMKWTDSMVRLLISVVYHVGDDVGGPESEQQQHPPHAPAAKGKKPTASALLQKKGKWKSVSRAMMEKGFYVSPQQCEDKFNDLNKRYKRVNDLLGKGTACRVVENQALLETMDHLSAKAKEEARKLLNSKHLFFREMCAYHNAGLASCSNSQLPPQAPHPPHAEQQQQQQQQCLHHPAGQMEAVGIKGSSGGGGGMLEEEGIVAEEDDEDDDVDSDDDDEYDDEDDEDDDDLDDHNHHKGHHHHRQRPHQSKHGDGEEDEDSKLGLGGGPAKRPRRTPSQQQLSSSASPPLSLSLSSPNFTSLQQLKSELVSMAGGGEQQQRQWLRKRASELEEQRVGYQSKAFQLERQRFKWLRFSSSKEREMERKKLENDRLRLENDRMLLLLRQKEIELIAGSRGGGPEHHHYAVAHSVHPAPDDQPSGTAAA